MKRFTHESHKLETSGSTPAFRNHIMTNIDCIYVNGDSWAHGYGLADDTRLDQCWGGLIAKHYGVEYIHNTQPGGSNQRIVRTMVQDLDQLLTQGRNPLVLISWTHLHRYELNRNDTGQWDRFSGTAYDGDLKLAEIVTAKYNGDHGNLENFFVQVLLIQAYLRDRGLKSLMFPTFRIPFEFMSEQERATIAVKADLVNFLHDFSLRGYLSSFNDIEYIDEHPGVEGHQLIADFLITQITRRNLIKNLY